MKKIYVLFVFLPISAFKLGVENISSDILMQLKHARVGIVTNQTGVDQYGRRTVDILRSKGAKVCAIFVPEHGLHGLVTAASDVADGIDKKTGLPVKSLYKNCSGHITAHTFDNVDLLVFDMQDVGMRHYTYISTLYTVMEAAAKADKKMVVLDRPNPLGNVMEGPLCDASLRSFVGIANIPLRHGMTIGELAQFFNMKCLKKKIELSVVPLDRYRRDIKLSSLPKHLSPNIKTLPSVHGYSFLGLLGEVRPFNVGVGTPHAFQVIMLPRDHNISERAWDQMRRNLQGVGVQSKRYTYYCDKKKQDFAGLLLQFNDINHVSGFKALLTVLSWAKAQKVPVDFSHLFDKAVGTHQVQVWYKSGESKEVLMQNVKQNLHDFLKTNKDVLLYQAHPKVVRYDPLCYDMMTI